MRRVVTWLSVVAVAMLAACGEQGERATPTGPSFSSAPTVTLGGQSYVKSGHMCEWYGQISGGAAPYTWTWSQSDGGTGYVNVRTTTLQSYMTSSTWAQWTLHVTVTDAWGRTASASKTINESWTAPDCNI